VSDYYDLLGVDAGADKDAIKAAYRNQLDGASQAERAKLNKAWNVLSDPVQRERYDDARAEGWLDDAESDADDVEETAPARRGGRAAAAPRQRGGRPAPEPTVVLPAGVELAEPRSRGLALLIDFSVLFVLYILALSLVLPALLKSQYPEQTKRIDAINRNIDTLDTFKSNADGRGNRDKPSASDAAQARKDRRVFQQDITCLAPAAGAQGADCSRARRLRDDRVAATSQTDAQASSALSKQLTTQSAWAQDRISRTQPTKAQAKQAKTEADRLQKQIDNATDEVTNISKDFQGFALLMYGGLLVIFLAYCVPSTAITGQTLGMKLRRVRVVRLDGSKVGWAGAFGRFVIPLAVALLLPQLGAIIGLGMVLWFLRDKNRQGVHDKLARTLVVEA
jgi:uncharacterized RDD family membrane protein YckC